MLKTNKTDTRAYISRLIKRLRTPGGYIPLTVLVVLMTSFMTIGRIVTVKYMVHSPIDDMIPFMPWMAYIYCSWYFYVIWAVLHTAASEDREYFRNIVFLTICFTVSNIIFIAFPNGIDFRPEAPESGPGSLLLSIIYGLDNPVNCFPSLHCSISLGAFLISLRSSRFPRKLLPFTFALSMAICFSTCAVKQHSVVDFFGALALVIIAWPIAEYAAAKFYGKKR